MRRLLYYSIIKYVLQCEKVRRPKTRDLCIPKSANLKSEESKSCRTNRIPSSARRESSGLTARIRTRYDVIEAREAFAIQPGVEEAKRGPAIRNQEVIEQRDYSCHCLYIGD